jgi:hypothetical protein
MTLGLINVMTLRIMPLKMRILKILVTKNNDTQYKVA